MRDVALVITDCVACSWRAEWSTSSSNAAMVIEAALEGWSRFAGGEWLCPEHTVFVIRGVCGSIGDGRFTGQLRVQRDLVLSCSECRQLSEEFKRAFECYVEAYAGIRRVESLGSKPTSLQQNQLNEFRFEAEQYSKDFETHRGKNHHGKR